MGRTACPKCKHEIDDLLNRCPLCGARTQAGEAFLKEQQEKKKSQSSSGLLIIAFIVFAFFTWTLWTILGSRLDTAPQQPSGMEQLDQP